MDVRLPGQLVNRCGLAVTICVRGGRYVGSANFSKAAWGSLKKTSFTASNVELGVVLASTSVDTVRAWRGDVPFYLPGPAVKERLGVFQPGALQFANNPQDQMKVVARLCLRVATHRRSIDTAECKFDSTPGLAPSDALRRKWAADAEATVGVSSGDVVEALTTPPLPK